MGIAEEVMVFLNVKGAPSLDQINTAMTKLGYNLRLAGRDMMRMGGSLQRLGTWMQSFAGGVFNSSDLIQDAFEDIGFALLDAFEATGIIDEVVGKLEWLAQVIEDNPWIALLLTILAVAGVVVFFLGKLFSVIGFMQLLVGTVLSAKSAHLGFIDTLRVLTGVLSGHTTAIQQNIAAEVAALAQKKAIDTQTKMDTFFTGQNTAAQKEAQKTQKKGGKGMATMAGIMGMTGLIFGGLLTLFFAAEPIMEIMGAIFEVVGDAVEIIIAPLEEFIWGIIEFFDAHPEMLAAILIAIATAIIAMKVTDFIGFLSGIAGGAATVMTKALPLQICIKGLGTAIIDLAIAIGILLFTMAGAIWILDQTKFTLPELIALIYSLTGAVILLGVAFVEMAIMIGPSATGLAALAPILYPIAVLLLAIGVAAFLVGAGFALAGVGIFLAGQGLALMAGLLPQLLVLVPTLFLLALGVSALGIAGFVAFGGLMALTIAIFALTAALLALTIPLGILRALGGEGAVVAAITKLPGFEEGGYIAKGGLAVVHPKETITPAKGRTRAPGGYVPEEPPMTVSVDITGAQSVEEIVQKSVQASVDQLSKTMERKYRRTEY